MDGVNPEALVEPLRSALARNPLEIETAWTRLTGWIQQRFNRDASLESILFLIGVQSRGRGYQRKLKKEVKQDLIMEGTYCAFETIGLYERIGADAEGNWIWECIVPHIPKLALEQQEKLLRVAVLQYFEPYLPTE